MTDTAKQISEDLGKLDSYSDEEKAKLYKTIGLGALKYYILKVDPKKRILFNPEESVDFAGNTGPFIQYTYARIQSIIRKADFDFSAATNTQELHEKEKELVKQSVLVGEIIQRMIAEDLHLSLDETKKTQMVLTLLETEGPEKGDPVPDQLMHCDVNTDDSTLDAKDAFIGILACQIGLTEIRVLPRSHVIAKSDSYSVPEYIYRVQLPQYHYLVGHPFLIHGGCGSLHRNTRLHFYHGLSEDSQSKTFFVPWRVSDRTERLKLMRANSKKANKNIVRRREKG
jgi:hypothetical protein